MVICSSNRTTLPLFDLPKKSLFVWLREGEREDGEAIIYQNWAYLRYYAMLISSDESNLSNIDATPSPLLLFFSFFFWSVKPNNFINQGRKSCSANTILRIGIGQTPL